MSSPFSVLSGALPAERLSRENFAQSLRESPIPNTELLSNLGLYLNRQTFSRLLFMAELYQHIIPVHGVAMEFGVRWGQNLALLHALRGIYEPFNYNRKIIGFDTFGGFPSVDAKDGLLVKPGDYGVSADYQRQLTDILALHEADSPISHKRKFELVAGDASETVPRYLHDHPETIIAFAYFDFDIYAPTKACLEAIRPRLTKGAVVAFDELNCPEFPGETQAFDEVFGVANYALRRSPLNPLISYLIM